MAVGDGRESLLSGLHAVAQEGRRNINGSKDDIAIRQCKHSLLSSSEDISSGPAE